MKRVEEKKEVENQIENQQRNIKYDIRDFPIKFINDEFSSGAIYIPEYQRHFIWNKNSQSKLIESILIGLPIPMMFFSTDKKTGNLEIVDGAQRTQTLYSFIDNQLVLSELKILPACNGFSFADLPSAVQRKFLNTALRTIVLEDVTTLASRKEIFNRINTQGVKANAVEVRMATYDGPFISFIKELSLDEKFQKVAPQSKANIERKEPYELLFRFFAYSDQLDDYSNAIRVQDFIDTYTAKHKNNFQEDRMRQEFNRTFDFADKNFPYGFKKGSQAKSVPKARFEALSVGINLALRNNPTLKIDNVDWLNSEEFQEVTTSDAANNKSHLLARINFVKDKLLNGGN